MTTDPKSTPRKKRTDGGNVEELSAPWDGSQKEYQHKSRPRTTTLYIPVEELQGGPLDFYMTKEATSRDKKHLVSGPEYREAVADVSKRNLAGEVNEKCSICGLKKIHLGFNDGLPHFLELLAETRFDGIDHTVPDLHDRPGDSGYRMISGSPLTVYQTCCEKCKNSYKSQFTTEEIETEVAQLTE